MVLDRVRNAPILYADETEIMIRGKETLNLGIHHARGDFCRDSGDSWHKSPDGCSDDEIQGNDLV